MNNNIEDSDLVLSKLVFDNILRFPSQISDLPQLNRNQFEVFMTAQSKMSSLTAQSSVPEALTKSMPHAGYRTYKF